jgi:hypothetical protein
MCKFLPCVCSLPLRDPSKAHCKHPLDIAGRSHATWPHGMQPLTRTYVHCNQQSPSPSSQHHRTVEVVIVRRFTASSPSGHLLILIVISRRSQVVDPRHLQEILILIIIKTGSISSHVQTVAIFTTLHASPLLQALQVSRHSPLLSPCDKVGKVAIWQARTKHSGMHCTIG